MKIFEKDDHKIIWGDAIEVFESELEDESIDLIFIDPPYNIGEKYSGFTNKWDSVETYLHWCYRWLDLCICKLKKRGTMYVMTATQHIPYFDIYLRDKIKILSRIIWYYDSASVQAKRYFGSTYEPILHCVKSITDYTFNASEISVGARTGAVRKLIDYRGKEPKPYNHKKVPGNVWEFARVRYRMEEYEDHPTQKPIVLLERIIKASSNEGDIVLDPFSGTFTTSYVAKQLKRKSIGIEISEEYVKIGLRRLEIASEYNGEVLSQPKKNYKHKTNNKQLILHHNNNDGTRIH